MERPGGARVVGAMSATSGTAGTAASAGTTVAGVFCAALAGARPGELLDLDVDAAHHVRVRRLAPGDAVRVVDGAGCVALGALASSDRRSARVQVERVERHERSPGVRLLVPVADRERMLWLAEKAVELGLAAWLPVMWDRSRSVAGRGEGEAFGAKVRARMAAALVQSGGTWLPEIAAERPLPALLAALGDGDRVVLDPAGAPLGGQSMGATVTAALGPEGGLAPAERELLAAAGFRPVSLSGNVLRFETAGVAALAILAHRMGTRHSPLEAATDA